MIIETFRQAIQNVWSNKLRTFLTMLGIIIGVMAVIVIVGLGNGMTKSMRDSFSALGTNTLSVQVWGNGSRTVSVEEMYKLPTEYPELIQSISPQIDFSGSGTLKIGTTSYRWSNISGVDENYSAMKNYQIAQGRGLQYMDMKDNKHVCVFGDYLNDNRTLDYGTGAVNYTVAQIPRSRFLGASWSYNKVIQKTATLTVSHDLNSKWKITSTTGYQGFSSELAGTTRPNASSQFIKTDGTWIRGLQKTTTEEKYFITQLDITGNFKTGRINHHLLVGADADKYITDAGAFEYKNSAAGNKNMYDSINIYDLAKYPQRNDIPFITPTTLTHTPTNRLGVYVQDMISISEKFKFLAGVRYTNIKRNGVYTDTLAKNTRGYIKNTTDQAYTPRFGLVYQPLKTIAFFASYSNSFVPNTGTDIYLRPLAASYLNQYELGIKTELFKKIISANLTVYQINNSNLAQMSLIRADGSANADANIKELAGAVSSKGLEVDITSKPFHGIQLISGYSFNETKYTSSNTYIVGSALLYNPQHTAHASVHYNFSNRSSFKGFSLGAMSYYIGKRVAGRSTRIRVPNDTYKPMPLPDYFQFDATLGYTYKAISIRARVSNIFNKLSYYVHDDNSVNPIAPTQFSGTLALKL